MQEQNIAIDISHDAQTYLAQVGYDPIYGARPLRRTMQRLIENNISSLLIKGDLAEADTVVVDYDGGELTFDVHKAQIKKVQPGQKEEPMQKDASSSPSKTNDQDVSSSTPPDTNKPQEESPVKPSGTEPVVEQPPIQQPVANPLQEFFTPDENSPKSVVPTPSNPSEDSKVTAVTTS